MIEKLIRVIYTKRLDQNGRPKTMYFIQLINKQRIAVKPCFKEAYSLLNLVSEVEYNDTLPQESKTASK